MSKYNEDLDYLIRDVDISKEELEEIIVEADKIISDANTGKDKLIEAYLKKVQCLQKLNKCVESVELINQLLNLNPDMPEALVRLGNAHYKNKKYDKAIEAYDKAIVVNPDYAVAYNNRGNSKCILENYHDAIADFDKAIEIDPKLANAYNNRGIVKRYLEDYRGAITDYDEVIKINPNYAKAYYNRGIAYKKINDYEKAAKDFIKAKTDILNVLISEKHTDEELINFSVMLPHDEFFKREIIQKCKEEEIKSYGDIYLNSLNIVAKLHVKNEIEMSVSHYTKKEVLEILLFDDYFNDKDGKDKPCSCFRLNSINTSNDPTEGKTLFHYLFPQKKMSSQVEEFGAFAGCFILNNDSLNQFRLYGKEKNEEGTGVSITLNKHFFSAKSKKRMTGMEMTSELNKEEEDTQDPLPLFRCIYIDPEMKEVISLGHKEKYAYYRENKDKEDGNVKNAYREYKKEIDQTQEDVTQSLIALNELINKSNLNHNMVYAILLRLRYLVKHAAFREEQECRIINIVELNYKDRVKMDVNMNNRLYVDYLKFDKKNVVKICFAPKAENFDKFKQHLARNNFGGIECYRSNAPLA